MELDILSLFKEGGAITISGCLLILFWKQIKAHTDESKLFKEEMKADRKERREDRQENQKVLKELTEVIRHINSKQ